MSHRQYESDGITSIDEQVESGSPHTSKVRPGYDNNNPEFQNPLAGISQDILLRDVENFARDRDLVEALPILKKGSLVAQRPDDFESITGEFALSSEEEEALRKEKLEKWKQPWPLYLTIFTCSIGAAVQGWDQTGSNGANLSFPEVFGIGSSSTKDTLLVGFVNAAPYIGSASVGCWCSDPLNLYIGRRGTIFVSALFCFFPIIGSALCQTWPQLFICRALLGFGMGAKGSTVPIFAAENSPAAIRGGLVMSWQLWTAFGIFLGTAANLAVVNTGSIAWRLQLGSALIPAVPLMLLIYLCPESPRWLIKKNRYKQAFHSLLKLRNNPVQAARDLYTIHTLLEIESYVDRKDTYFSRIVELFTMPRVRRATLASTVVMIGQQLCGINIIAFYSSTIFINSGFSEYQALFASFGFGLVNFLFAFPAIITIDTFGRRALLLFTFPNMAWSLLAAGLSALIDEKKTAHIALVALFVYIFTMWYSPGEGPVPWAYSAEVFPLSHREAGMAWAVATNLFWAAMLTVFLPFMLEAMGTVGIFIFYACTNLITLVLIFLFVPETKQRTLEELDFIFNIPTHIFIKYQVTQVLPWSFKRWVLFKDTKLEPLHSFAGVNLKMIQVKSPNETHRIINEKQKEY